VEPAAFFRRRFVFRLVRAILLRPFVAGFTKANISPGFVLRLFFRRTDPVALFRRFLAGLKIDPYPVMTRPGGFRLRAAALLFFVRASRTAPFAR
jgi:hypothetical protein